MKEGLTEKGIKYEEIDVSLPENEKIFDEVVKISETEAVPTVIVGKNLLAPDINFSSIKEGVELVKYIIENE
jgi:glutaredoxin